jgi:methylated-DNA-[protein]-cysteine S-methyltransferase
MLATRIISCPLGDLHLAASSTGVRALSFTPLPPAHNPTAEHHLDLLADELARYFDGTLSAFTVPLDLVGTDFRKRVWHALLEIPLAQTRSYIEIARAIGNPAASRAVGLANGANPIAIVVPCHRVIGSSGKLVGYGGELWRKQWLLEHEGVAAAQLFTANAEESCTAAARYSLPC